MLVIFKLSFWISLLFSCRPVDPVISNKIIDSVEFQESRGVASVRDNGYCVGLMQIDRRYSPIQKPFLQIPYLNRIIGVRALRYWYRRAGGDMHHALSGYNCGNAGLNTTCGSGYASAVLNRNLVRKRKNPESCFIMGNIINYYFDNKHYLVKWRNKLWHYQQSPQHQRQQR